MSFIDGFYTFNVELANVENNIYDKLFLKLPKHPNESFEFLLSKVIAYCHAYEKDLNFSQGFYSPEDPTIWKKNILNEIETWIQLESCSYKKLHKAVKQNPLAKFSMYFHNIAEPQDFCYEFRAIKTKDFQKVKFFLIDENFLQTLIPNISSRMNWNINFIDDTLYFNWENLELESRITELNIWDIYQQGISNS